MANDSHDGTGPSGAHPTPAEARDALGRLDVDSAGLARRVVTPRWYHPTLGLIVAVLIANQAIPAPGSLVGVALGVVALPLLAVTYSRRYGVPTSRPAGPRSRRLLLLGAGVLVAGLVAALIIKLTGTPTWWVLVPAAVSFPLTVTLGRRYDDALRDELSRHAGERA